MSVPNNRNAVRNAQRAALRARVPAEVRALNYAERRNTRLTSPEFRTAENNQRATARNVPGIRDADTCAACSGKLRKKCTENSCVCYANLKFIETMKGAYKFDYL